jgi:hypothetical protein
MTNIFSARRPQRIVRVERISELSVSDVTARLRAKLAEIDRGEYVVPIDDPTMAASTRRKQIVDALAKATRS